MLLINLRKLSDSTVDKGCISSIIYSESKLRIFCAGMEFLANTSGNVHCLFGSLSSVSLLHRLFSVSGLSASFATNTTFLCIAVKCFLKLEVVFLAEESVLPPPFQGC